MAYLIDTDIVLDHLAAHPDAVKLLDALADSGLFISIITYMEAYQSVLRSPHQPEAEEQFAAFVAVVPTPPFSEDVARRCAELREALRTAGKRVPSRALDLLIAATAVEHGLTLVTRNTDDYADIPGLLLYQS
ncbi:MAG TPA: type II toxin-antitoxin system VapC family toxin [Thermomicrobiales bacterium]|nr:type II toxin-antitoxin system VapC family toxin [Thermomicrobiales bacterium]